SDLLPRPEALEQGGCLERLSPGTLDREIRARAVYDACLGCRHAAETVVVLLARSQAELQPMRCVGSRLPSKDRQVDFSIGKAAGLTPLDGGHSSQIVVLHKFVPPIAGPHGKPCVAARQGEHRALRADV